MDRARVAARLMAAEREYRRAQLEHDGGEQAARRYAQAAAELAQAEREADAAQGA